ncbi:MAG: DUF6704 family protein [Lacisediminihabitans sp.]
MSDDTSDPGHGNSPAAWTAVIIMLVAFAIGTVAFFLDLAVVVWACAGLVIVGLIVGWVLARVGYGVGGPRYVPKEH